MSHHNPPGPRLSTYNQNHAQFPKNFYVSPYATISICSNLYPSAPVDDKSHFL